MDALTLSVFSGMQHTPGLGQGRDSQTPDLHSQLL